MSIIRDNTHNLMKLHYSYTKGEGIPIVFLQGNSLSSSIFCEAQGTMRKSHSIYLVDLPGHGQSAVMNEYCFSGMIKVVRDFLNYTIEEPFIVVAHSLSGHIILQCLEELHQVKGLLLVGTPPLGTIGDMTEAFNSESSALLFKQSWSTTELDDLSVLLSKTNPDLVRSALLSCNPKFKTDFLKGGFIDIFKNEIEIIKDSAIPIAVTWSKDDPFLNHDYLTNRIEQLSNKRIRTHKYESGGHLPFVDERELFLSYLHKFILSLN